MKRLRRKPLPVIAEKCITESEFDIAVDRLVKDFADTVKAAEKESEKAEIYKAIVNRIKALECLQELLFGKEPEDAENYNQGEQSKSA